MYNPASVMWFLRNSLSTGIADVTFCCDTTDGGGIPVVGDWTSAHSGQPQTTSGTGGTQLLSGTLLVSQDGGTMINPGLFVIAPSPVSQTSYVPSNLAGASIGQAAGNTVYVGQNAAVQLEPDTPLQSADPQAIDYVIGLGDLDSSATSVVRLDR
jgi:hypothetical protein